MSNESEYHKIRKDAAQSRVTPPDSAWNKLQLKLKEDQISTKPKSLFARYLVGIAATVMLMLMTYQIVQLNVSQKNNLIHGKIAAWENLDSSPDYFYSVKDVRALKQYYPVLNAKVIN